MPTTKADLILHPIRLRILTAISSAQMAAKDIAKSMPEVPLTTLYRHLNTLLEGRMLKIVAEIPVRGTVERIYALTSPPSLAAEDLRGMTRQDCEQAFSMFLTTLMSDAQHYLQSKSADAEFNPIEDGVQITKVQLCLDEREFQQMSDRLLELTLAAAQNQPAPGRRRRMFSCLFIPMDD